MIISTNKEPSSEEFELLCNRMCTYMNDTAKEEPEYYLSKGAQKLEPEVKTALDIVAARYYGVEVKSTKDYRKSTVN